MAIIGQCKACGNPVSDEAAACPKCGQPSPYRLLPSVGSVHVGHITSVYFIGSDSRQVRESYFYYDNFIADVTIPSGVTGSLKVSFATEANARARIGGAIRGSVASVDSRNGEVVFKLAE